MDDILKQALQHLSTGEKLTPSQWVEKYRVLAGYAAEPGKFRISRAPYQREWLDVITSGHQQACLMTSAQVGKSETVTNLIGYLADTARTPTPMLVIYPTLAAAAKFSRKRIASLFRDTPRLRDKLNFKSRNTDNSLYSKNFMNSEATLELVGSNSPTSLAMDSIRVLIADEIDKYEATVEGDVLELANKRTTTYTHNAFRYYISTPALKGKSNIERLYNISDKREFFVKCPYCEIDITFVVSQLSWDKGHAVYNCPSCSRGIHESYKPLMMETGKGWVAQHPDRASDMVGFHINELYSPWSTWAKVLKAKEACGDIPTLVQPFVNTVEGLPYDLVAEDAPSWQHLYEARIPAITDMLPEKPIKLLASCDVQLNRLVVLICGYYRFQMWVVDYIIIDGDTSNLEDPCWDKLDTLMNKKWKHPTCGFDLTIHCMAIDMNYRKIAVLNWAKPYDTHTVTLVRGASQHLDSVLGTPSDVEIKTNGGQYKRYRAHKLWHVNTSLLKDEVYTRMKREDPNAPDYIQFSEVCDTEFFRQLASEVLVPHTLPNGTVQHQWKPVYENHVLDCMVYNLACYYRLRFHDHSEEDWRHVQSGDMHREEERRERLQLPHREVRSLNL